jgi:FGGY-family pentulose kinase
MPFYVGIDVGTGSARAGVFDATGRMHGMGTQPIRTWKPEEDHVEQSSADIWRACGLAVGAALAEAKVGPEQIAGIGFDATCSLVALGAGDAPVTVSRTGEDAQNVIVWMDHRAMDQVARINAGGHAVLKYVGGVMSPEMETPKLLWLKENLPQTWSRTTRFFDLPDFLVYRATGVDVRSLCTTTCKWTYLGHEGRWDDAFFRAVGLGDLADESFARIGTHVRPMGERAGRLTEAAAAELGLTAGTPVGVSIIDAHAGGVGMLGVALGGKAPQVADLERRIALIGGTSSCHMAVSREAKFVPGVWGPYFSSMVPGMWLSEGGQSATGALIDHVVHSHARGAALSGANAYAALNERLAKLATKEPFPAALTRDLHVLPDHHGNRSPRADATLRGMISGLKLTDSVDALALVYLATIQAIAHGTKHILDVMNANGYAIDTIIACGGDAKNPIFLREHADVTGCRIVLPKEPEAVLLGAAILGAVASGDRASVVDAMGAMTAPGRVVEPAGGAVATYHAAKHRVFLRMYDDQMAYRKIMAS